MSQETQRKLAEYMSNPANAEISKLIVKGKYDPSTSKITITNDQGQSASFTIEELLSNAVTYDSLFPSKVQDNVIPFPSQNVQQTDAQPQVGEANQDDEIEEILDENVGMSSVNPTSQVQHTSHETPVQNNMVQYPNQQSSSSRQYTLYDLNNSVEEKDVDKVDEMLTSFAVNPNTGLVDVDRAIRIATTCTLNEAIKCAKENKHFSSDLSHYNLKGESIVKQDELSGPMDPQEISELSFNNILVFVKVAKLKGIIYDDAKQEKAKQQYSAMLIGKLNTLGLNNQNSLNSAAVPEQKNVQKELTLKPDTDLKKAGFADIFILTIIILVYAIIIINLVTKLK